MDNPFTSKTEEVKNEVAEEVVEVVDVKEETTKLSVLNAKQQILKDYGGNESDVPINSPYWKLKG